MQHVAARQKIVRQNYASQAAETKAVDEAKNPEIPPEFSALVETGEAENSIEASEPTNTEHVDEVLDTRDSKEVEDATEDSMGHLGLVTKNVLDGSPPRAGEVRNFNHDIQKTDPNSQYVSHDNLKSISDLVDAFIGKDTVLPEQKDESTETSTLSDSGAGLGQWKDDEKYLDDSEYYTEDRSITQQATEDVNSQQRFRRAAVSKKIHIVGTRSIGKFIAHCLTSVPNPPPVTLLLHTLAQGEQWANEGGAIRLIRDQTIEPRFNFNVESLSSHGGKGSKNILRSTSVGPGNTPIDNLIVTTEGHTTVSTLLAIKYRLKRSSTICFIENGLGVVELVNAMVFPDPAERPSYMLGNISHDVHATERHYTVVERRPGTLSLTMLPAEDQMEMGARNPDARGRLSFRKVGEFGWTPQSRYLMRTLSRVPALHAKGFIRAEFFKVHLEKLAINCVLGPLSVAYDCTNDNFLSNYHISRTMKMLINEVSMVLQSLPLVSRNQNLVKSYSPERLEAIILSVIAKTGRNRTAMLQDVTVGRRTSIDFYNGYLLDRAAELGIQCPIMEMVVSLVKGKAAIKSRERNSYVPFRDDHSDSIR